MEQHTIELWDGQLHPVWFQGGDGPQLVFLHGVLGSSPADPLLQALEQSYEVVAPVHPGFNELAELDDIRDVHDLALYYDDLLQALGIEQATLVGHSFGGMVAAEIAAHVPRRVARLVLAAPLGLWNDAYPVQDLFAVPLPELPQMLWDDPNSPAANAVTAATSTADPDAENPMLEMLLSAMRSLTTAAKFLWPLPDKGLARRLRRITAPTLVVWGAKDQLAPAEYARDFASGIRDARAEVLPDAGHMVVYERQDEFLRHLADFLSGRSLRDQTA